MKADFLKILFKKPAIIIKIINGLFQDILFQSIYFLVQIRHRWKIRAVSKKTRIKVAFFLIHEPVWKYEVLYRLLVKNDRFEPVVIVCPFMVYGTENMLRDMNQAYNSFLDKGYNVIKTYDKDSDKWLDIKKTIKPDIVFFTLPHPVTKNEYYIKNFMDTLTCYVPYTFQTTYHYQQNYNRFFHNVLWKAYYQTTIHYEIAKKYSKIKAKNVIVSGYPGIDLFITNDKNNDKKNENALKKKIIWAPHHTIEGEGLDLNFSCFLRYYDFMIELATNYKDKIFITFKPHPALRAKLYKEEIWGKERTNRYFDFWGNNNFCALNEGNYQELFLESDAMIHDCDSFMGEYLSLNKPVLYTYRDEYVKDRFNDFGKHVYDLHYKAGDEDGILFFINEIVINGKDEMKLLRNIWIKKYLLPPGSGSASENIYNDLKKELNIDEI
ncbi:MAG: CDP-glycerol--glycerophosphate glycerophosphotransferase [Fibrobacter sp.]|nr:CDP-glycerol--glycerophosphate glycerophosphotransferase [Fibrobacter sp.]